MHTRSVDTAALVRVALLAALTAVTALVTAGFDATATAEEPPDLLNATTAVVDADDVVLIAAFVTSIPEVDEPEWTGLTSTTSSIVTTTTTVAPPPPPTTNPTHPTPSTTTSTIATTTTTVAPPTTTLPAGGFDAAAEAAFIGLIDAARSDAGVGRLARAGALDAYARGWAETMAAAGTPSHSGLGGAYGQWSITGENVGVGPNASVIFSALAGSGPHLANMTHPDFTHVGVGVWIDGSGQMWTVHVFGG